MKENKMYQYLLDHNYVSENKKSNYQGELSIERAECIANKFNSLVEEEKQSLIKYLEDKIKENQEFVEKHPVNLYTKEHINRIEIYREILDKIKEGNYE